MDIFSPINNSLVLLSHLRKISDEIKAAELKIVIADLSNELADVKLAAADLKDQLVSLREENASLKHQMSPKEKPKIKWECYYFDDDDSRLFCTACYDSKGVKSLTTRTVGGFRRCNVCGANIGR